MSSTKELQYRKTALISAQRKFTAEPSATNWQKLIFQMEYYQLVFDKVREDRESRQIWAAA